MVYLARVYKNSDFGTNGTIDVMLCQKYHHNGLTRDFEKGLYKRADKILKNLKEGQTVKAIVMSPVGNAYNTGAFQLPQVGALGVVYQLDNYNTFTNVNFIWMGGIYGFKQFGEKVILPSDDTTSFDLNASDKTLIVDSDEGEDTISGSEYIKKGQIVLKTKTCQIDDYTDIDSNSLDYKNIPTENTVVLNKEKIAVRHNTWNNSDKIGIAHLSFDDDKIRITRETGASGTVKKLQNIIIDDDSITVEFNNKSTNKSYTAKIGDDGSLTVNASGNVTIASDEKLNVNVKGNAVVKSNGTMTVQSNNIMTIKANGINLANVIYKLAENVKYLQTFGSPSLHATMPTSQSAISTTETLLKTGFSIT